MQLIGLFYSTICCICWHSLAVRCEYPEIDLGEVDLSSNPECSDKLQPHLIQCTNQYRDKVSKAMEMANFNATSELVRRTACCDIWVAQRCMSRAARSVRECGIKEARAFEKLPIDGYAIAQVNRHCKGLDYASRHCSASDPTFNGNTFLRLLFLCSLLNVLVVKTFAIY